MADQMSLPALDAVKPPFKPAVIDGQLSQAVAYNLFLAIFPTPEDALQMASIGEDLRQRHHLDGGCVRADHSHITMHMIERLQGVIPQEVVDAALAAAASVTCPPLPIVFDRVCSFKGGKAKKKPLVLRCDARSDAAVARLRQSLGMALRRRGLKPQPTTTPHTTMLYDQRVIPELPIEPPLRWIATRFALVLSHVGLGHHQWIGCWDLTDRP